MGYTEDVMRNLTYELKRTKEFSNTLKEFNLNISSIDRLASALEKYNELKERELNILENKEELSRGKHL